MAETAYTENMTGPRGTSELNHYEERLRMIFDDKRYQVVKRMLTQTAVTGSLNVEDAKEACAQLLPDENSDDLLLDLLYTLEHDGYIKQKDGGYVFVSHLVRDWWKNRFGVTYQPARERTVS
jgi:hypothetical protein